MVSSNSVFAMAMLVVILIAGAAAIQYAYEGAHQRVSATNESWTADLDAWTTLEHSNTEDAIYDETVTVRDNTSTVLEAGTDYEWSTENGSVMAISGGELAQGENATISYGLEQPTKESSALYAMITGIANPGIPIVGVLALLAIGYAAVEVYR